MRISKKLRQEVYEKYNGLCAYTGQPLEDDWQVDHVTSKIKHTWDTYYKGGDIDSIKEELKKVHDIENLLPACRIINHYKRSLDLEGFRRYMTDFHKRLKKLPKKTNVPRTQKRKDYMYRVASLFGITEEQPFCGVFYFETL